MKITKINLLKFGGNSEKAGTYVVIWPIINVENIIDIQIVVIFFDGE